MKQDDSVKLTDTAHFQQTRISRQTAQESTVTPVLHLAMRRGRHAEY